MFLKNKNKSHPTKKEYYNNLKQIRNELLNSKEFEEAYKNYHKILTRLHLKEEEELLNILNSKNKNSIKFDKLETFLSNLDNNIITNNYYLEAANYFFKSSLIDCHIIFNNLKTRKNGNICDEETDTHNKYNICINLPIERKKYLKDIHSTCIPLKYYKPKKMNTKYEDVLDKEFIKYFIEDNEITNKLYNICFSIYKIQLYNLLEKNNDKNINIEKLNIVRGDLNQIKVTFVIKKQEKKENVTFTNLDELINIALKKPNIFYKNIASNLSKSELIYIINNLENKDCTNCSNNNYCLSKNDNIDKSKCPGWMNLNIIGKSKVLNKNDIRNLY